MKKIIFLDRDGTINVDTGYTHKISDFKFEKNAVNGLKRLQEEGFEFIITTNQSGIARNFFDEQAFWKFNDYVVSKLRSNGIHILKTYFSPYHPEKGVGKYKKNSSCRKPGFGMLKEAAKEFDMDKKNSWVIGDKWADVKAGADFGARTILVQTGKAGTSDFHYKVDTDYIAEDLLDAAKFIAQYE